MSTVSAKTARMLLAPINPTFAGYYRRRSEATQPKSMPGTQRVYMALQRLTERSDDECEGDQVVDAALPADEQTPTAMKPREGVIHFPAVLPESIR